jgi:phosphoesterase RecJ-like protein
MNYHSTVTMHDLAERIRAATTIVCTSHEKPDGDAVGSVLGLVRALASDKTMHAWLLGSVPPAMEAMTGDTPWTHVGSAEKIPDVEPDLIIVLDTGAWSQLDILEQWLRARADRVIGLDHHASGDDVAPQRVVDSTAAACTLLVLQLIDCLGIELDMSIAESLFGGLATDTGWFRQANADAAAFAAAARLLACGVDKDGLYRMIEETARPQRLALHARALATAAWVHDGEVAIMRLTRADFTETGGRRSEVVGLVNAPLVVQGAEMSVLLVEEFEGGVKASMRSKPPRTPGGPFIDVRAVAMQLGGGGHVHAAGVRLDGDLDAAAESIVQALAHETA